MKVDLNSIRDGQGNTILLSENVNAYRYHVPGKFINNYFIRSGPTRLYAFPFDGNDEVPGGNPRSFIPSNGFVWMYTNQGQRFDSGAPAWRRPNYDIDNQPILRINGTSDPTERLEDLSLKGANSIGDLRAARPSSYHSGGVNVCFADGHTEFLRDNISYQVYMQLLTPNGTKSDMPVTQHVLSADDYQ